MLSAKQDKKIERMLRIYQEADKDFPTHEEVAAVITPLNEKVDMVRDRISNLESGVEDSIKEIREGVFESHEELVETVDKVVDRVETLENKPEPISKEEVAQMIPPPTDFSHLESEIKRVEEKIPTIPEIPDEMAPEEIRDRLELLNDDERLKIEAIKNLREELDELKKLLKKSGGSFIGGVGGGGTAGKTVRAYDLSSQLNGVLKTFAIPATWRVISVHSSSSPFGAFRETVDYTWTNSSITFTSQIDESTVLSAGQSLIIVYAEA